MNEILKKKRKIQYIKHILAPVVVILVLLIPAALWLFPRTNWSLKGKLQGEFSREDVSRTKVPLKEIRSVVLISIDTCRADHLSCYGYSRKTSPNIDAVSAEAVRFNHCITPVPITLPAHSSMMTGTIPLYHKVRDNENYRLDDSNVTLAEILRDNGFSTGAVIGAFVLDSEFGLDQGFDSYDDSLQGKENKARVFYNERNAAEVTRLANIWLQEHQNEKMFLFLHYFDVHAPYRRHKRFVPPLRKHLYDGEIIYTDYHISRVIRKLKELNLYDSTLLIITADHGESLRQHNETTHGFFIYHSTLHVPLIFKVPGGPKAVVNDAVTLVDIVPTVCGLLGLKAPSAVQGKDLSEYFLKEGAGEGENDRFLYCESLMPTKLDVGPLIGLVSGRWKYIHTSESELYDLGRDPHETKNLLKQQSQQASIMQEQLKSVVQNTNLKAVTAKKTLLDEQTRNRLQSLGYISGKTIDEGIQFNQSRTDPKKLVEAYNSFEAVLTYTADGKYSKAKEICNKMLKKWPDMKEPYFHLGKIALLENDKQAIIRNFSAYLANEESAYDSSDAFQIKPEYSVAYSNLGVMLAREGKLNQAMEHYRKALFYNPYSVKANYNLAGVYFRQNKLADAIIYYSKVLDLDSEMPEANYMMGNIQLKQGNFDKAIMHFNNVLKVTPGKPKVEEALQAAKRQLENVILRQLKSLEQKPNQPELHNNLGILFHNQRNFEKAVYHWEMALKLKPEWADVLNSLAWVKAVHKNENFHDATESIRLATRACELTNYERPDFLDTLAAAYAAGGRFDIAVETAQEAIELAQSENQRQLITEIRKHLSLYRAGKPYVEP